MTPKYIIISFLAIALSVFSITEAIAPKISDLPKSQIQSLSIQNEIKKNSDTWKAAEETRIKEQDEANDHQKKAEENLKIRDQAEANNVQLKAKLIQVASGAVIVEGTETLGKTQPSL